MFGVRCLDHFMNAALRKNTHIVLCSRKLHVLVYFWLTFLIMNSIIFILKNISTKTIQSFAPEIPDND